MDHQSLSRGGLLGRAVHRTTHRLDGPVEVQKTIVVNARKNNTSWWHPTHLHGFSLHVLTRNGIPVRRTWHDTLFVEPHETADLTFIADNPGDWMLHCHATDHEESGLMAVIRVS
jgi:FtsP/CotA-like multicopper oxidase with cupredoxin domain